jgi:hypothetical protein
MRYRFYTRLSINECLHRLREQVQPKTFWNRIFLFARRSSKIVGRVTDKGFILEASHDLFSKRMKGRLVKSPSGTIIEFEWEKPFWSRLYGSYKFDENEILTFLKDWLDANPSDKEVNK